MPFEHENFEHDRYEVLVENENVCVRTAAEGHITVDQKTGGSMTVRDEKVPDVIAALEAYVDPR